MSTLARMRELWPSPSETVNIATKLAQDARQGREDQPWVSLVMISSLDGAAEIDGVSGGLGGPADRDRFLALRRLADTIVVGANTAVSENYKPVSRIAIVSGSLSLDPASRLFGDQTRQPIIYTLDEAAESRGTSFDGIAEIRSLGDSISAPLILADLARLGSAHVALEGGPTLNAMFAAQDCIDEILLTVAPIIVAGPAARIVTSAEPLLRRFSLDRVLIDHGMTFLRYLRDGDPAVMAP